MKKSCSHHERLTVVLDMDEVKPYPKYLLWCNLFDVSVIHWVSIVFSQTLIHSQVDVIGGGEGASTYDPRQV